MQYKEQNIRFDISNFAYQKTDENRYDGHYKMLDVFELKHNLDTLISANEQYKAYIQKELFDKIEKERRIDRENFVKKYSENGKLSTERERQFEEIASKREEFYKSEIENYKMKMKSDMEYIRRLQIELHRKFTLSAACLILFFIGAPLGAIIRKGGLGMPVVISTLAFIIYHILGQIGENAALEGEIPVWFGMWLSSLVFLPIGLVLTMKATSDSTVLSHDSWIKAFSFIKDKIRKKKHSRKNEDTANLL